MSVSLSIVIAVLSALLSLPAVAAEAGAYLVQHARMRTVDDDVRAGSKEATPVDLLWNHHLLERGEGSVLVIRDLREGPGVDEDRFTFLTVEVPPAVAQSSVSLPADGLLFYFSTGAKVWLSKGAGVYADAAKGRITFNTQDDGRMQVDITISMSLRSASRVFTYPDKVRTYADSREVDVVEFSRVVEKLPAIVRR